MSLPNDIRAIWFHLSEKCVCEMDFQRKKYAKIILAKLNNSENKTAKGEIAKTQFLISKTLGTV